MSAARRLPRRSRSSDRAGSLEPECARPRALYADREEPLPDRRGAILLECGDLSPLLRRRLVAVELPCGSGHAGAPALARAVNAPANHHASRSLTATSRLAKAVTSHRTPKPSFRDNSLPAAAIRVKSSVHGRRDVRSSHRAEASQPADFVTLLRPRTAALRFTRSLPRLTGECPRPRREWRRRRRDACWRRRRTRPRRRG